MSIETNKAAVGRFMEAVNAGNLDAFDDFVAEDFVEHEALPGLPTRGPEAPKAAIGMFRAAFPNLEFSADELLADGDKVVMTGQCAGEGFKIGFGDIVIKQSTWLLMC